jgi:hypothetical protein
MVYYLMDGRREKMLICGVVGLFICLFVELFIRLFVELLNR